jgi:hypothetical protein
MRATDPRAGTTTPGGCHWLSRSGSVPRPGHGLILIELMAAKVLRSLPDLAAMQGCLGLEPGIQGFSDRGRGCLWIALVTCIFCDCKRSLSVVIFGYLDGFCDHKVSKRSSAQRDRRRSCTPGVVWRPLDLASPEHTPARGHPPTELPPVPCSSAPGLACGSPLREVEGTPPRPTRPTTALLLVASHPRDLPPGEGRGR